MKKQPKILFKEHSHSYISGDKRLISVNKLLSHFGFDFDRDYWLTHKGIEMIVPNFYKSFFSKGFNFKKLPTVEKLIESFSNEMNQDQLDQAILIISDEWEQSSINGTKFHKDQECLAYNDGFIFNPYSGEEYSVVPEKEVIEGYSNYTTKDNLIDLEDGVHLEAIVWNSEYGVAGTVDELFIETINGERFVGVGDHKTNKKKPTLKSDTNCLYPIEHLLDCNYTKYSLQVSMYAYLLEIAGFSVRNVGFYHYNNYDPDTKSVITVKYLGDECRDLLEVYKNLS